MKTVTLLLVLGVVALAQSGAWIDEPWLAGKPGAKPAGPTFAESLHSYNVRHYRLDINLPMTDKSYTAHEALSIRSDEPSLSACTLHFVNLVCDSVKRAGTALSFTTPSGLLAINLDSPLPQNDSTVLDIFYHRESTATARGYYFARPPSVTHAYCMTCTPPEDARYWMPCYDAPMDKAERGVELNLTVPDSFQTCANGLLDSVTSGAGTKTYWWNHPYSIATYLIVFSASRFATWQHDITLQTGDTLPSIYFMWPEDSAVSRNTFSLIPDMMGYFSDSVRFGPYPFEKYGMVPGYTGFPWGGMENQTMTMIHTQWLRSGSPIGMAHELSHMWWGDMVTCVDFANVWLNEGFATWAECLYNGHLNGRSQFESYIASKGRSYFSQHRSRDFPMYNPPPAEIYNGGIIYAKGSWVMRMLQFVEGDTAWQNPGIFFRALRAYGDSFKYGTASTEDFQRINEQFSGQNLDWFFNEWVYDRGYPRYTISWDKQPLGDSWQVTATLAQHNDTNSARLFHMPYPIRFNCGSESTVVTFHPQDTVAVDTFVLAAEPLSMTPDPANWVLDSSFVTGIEEGYKPQAASCKLGPSIIRGVLFLPRLGTRSGLSENPVMSRAALLDAMGRKVTNLQPGPNDVSKLAPGIYFVRQSSGVEHQTSCVVTKVLIAR
ncbi:M1 family metallopeptidase [candidate division WOR-3 bacterium]|nr:M1 family metallopeptidase [candidate division WOR-3 bacterium]